MDSRLSTSRLKFTLIAKAERGSPELEWMHELRSDKQTTWWSIHGQSTSLSDTERFLKHCLPDPEHPNLIRIAYAIHEIPSPDTAPRFIGLITLKSSPELSLPEANHLMPSSALLPSALNLELGYQFLPKAWGRGLATEALEGMFRACREAKGVWDGWERVYVRAIVDDGNKGSLNVMRKSEMKDLGVHVWRGEEAWMAGEMRGEMVLWIWGCWVKGEES